MQTFLLILRLSDEASRIFFFSIIHFVQSRENETW